MSISTDPNPERKVAELITARAQGKDHTANQLISELIRSQADAFTLMLNLARHAAWPAIHARRTLAEQGEDVGDVIPRTTDMDECERIAITMVAHFANGDQAEAVDLAGVITPRITERTANGRPLPLAVVAELVDICAFPPNVVPVSATYAAQARNPSAN
jgi:hypothetical protein